jgi:tRNA nucleotidyltransferase (CCA-adding enzyme)
MVQEGPPLRLEDLAVDGRDLIGLGLRPGPRFGHILQQLMDVVLKDPDLNTREQLLKLVTSSEFAEEAEEGAT